MQSKNISIMSQIREFKVKPNPNLPDLEGRTPLHIACIVGNVNGVIALVKYYGEDLRLEIRNKGGETPLFFAALSCSLSTVEACLTSGCNPFTFNNLG